MLKQFTLLLAFGLVFGIKAQAQVTATETQPAQETNVQDLLTAETIKLRRGITDDINATVVNTPEEEQKAFVDNVNAYHKRIGAEDKIVPVTDVKDKEQMRRHIKKAIGMEDVIVNPASLEEPVAVAKSKPEKYRSRAAEALK